LPGKKKKKGRKINLKKNPPPKAFPFALKPAKAPPTKGTEH